MEDVGAPAYIRRRFITKKDQGAVRPLTLFEFLNNRRHAVGGQGV